MRSFTGHRGYQGQWVTAQEEQQAWEEDEMLSQEIADLRKQCCILEWTASNGQSIEIWVWSTDSVTVKLAGNEYGGCEFKAIPAAQQAKAKEMGIVCFLGPIALNAERKAIVEAAIRKF